jgi:hypothetical protein
VAVIYPGAVERLPRASKASDGGPGLSGGTILSWQQEQKAKNVTNNLPLLSVLVVRCFLLIQNLFDSLTISDNNKFRKPVFEFRGVKNIIMLISWK